MTVAMAGGVESQQMEDGDHWANEGGNDTDGKRSHRLTGDTAVNEAEPR